MRTIFFVKGMKKDLLQQILYPHYAESQMGRFEQVFI